MNTLYKGLLQSWYFLFFILLGILTIEHGCLECAVLVRASCCVCMYILILLVWSFVSKLDKLLHSNHHQTLHHSSPGRTWVPSSPTYNLTVDTANNSFSFLFLHVSFSLFCIFFFYVTLYVYLSIHLSLYIYTYLLTIYLSI